MAAAGETPSCNLTQAELAADSSNLFALALAIAQHELISRRRVGGALMAFSALLEGLQAFTPDRSSNLVAAVCGAGGALAAALLAALFIRARRWRAG